MIASTDAQLKADLTLDEGRRTMPYVDSRGFTTIGIGHNLSVNGIPNSVVDALYECDISYVLATLNAAIPWWGSLPDQAQRVMANLCFNMGWKTLATFRQFLAAMQAHDWQRAAQELKNSKWWGQVGERGPRIVQRLLACAAPTS